jgi:hypothetical protein
MPERSAPPGLEEDQITAVVANALIRLSEEFASFTSGGRALHSVRGNFLTAHVSGVLIHGFGSEHSPGSYSLALGIFGGSSLVSTGVTLANIFPGYRFRRGVPFRCGLSFGLTHPRPPPLTVVTQIVSGRFADGGGRR